MTTITRCGPISYGLKFWADIEDGPVLTVTGSSHKGKQFKANRAHFVYYPTDGQWRLRYVDVWGSALKKDGTVGALDVHCEYSSSNITAWVAEMAEHFRPKEPAPVVANTPVTVTV